MVRFILAIRSGDYYMYEYGSDEEEEELEEEENKDESTVAQEQVLFISRGIHYE